MVLSIVPDYIFVTFIRSKHSIYEFTSIQSIPLLSHSIHSYDMDASSDAINGLSNNLWMG